MKTVFKLSIVLYFCIFYPSVLSLAGNRINLELKSNLVHCRSLLENKTTILALQLWNLNGFFYVDDAYAPKIFLCELSGCEWNTQNLLQGFTMGHEWESSKLFANVLQNLRGESLIFMPKYLGRSVPGYDGIIVNSKLEITANYSLKNLLLGNNLRRTVINAIKDAQRYSQLCMWMRIAGIYKNCLKGGKLKPSKKQLKGSGKQNDFDWLQKATTVFGVEEGRSTIIVIEIPETSKVSLPSDIEINQFQMLLLHYVVNTNKDLHKVDEGHHHLVIVKSGVYIYITVNDVQKFKI